MVQLPRAFAPYLVRTAYSDEATWHAVRDAVLSDANEYGFLPDLVVVDDPAYDGLGAGEVAAAVPPDHTSSFVVVVDADASGVFRGFWDDPPGAAREVASTGPSAPSAPTIGPRYLVLDLECCERPRPIHRFHAVLQDGAATLTHGAGGLGPVATPWEPAPVDPAGSVDVVCPGCGRRATIPGAALAAFVQRYELAFDVGTTGRITWGIDPFLDELRRLDVG